MAETRTLPRGYVATCGNRIASIGEDWRSIRADETIDVSGLDIIPGLIDMHTHGIDTVSFMESDEEECLWSLQRYAVFGVTKVVASTISNPLKVITGQLQRLRRVKEKAGTGALLHGVHVEGPWLAPRCRGGHPLEYLRVPDPDEIRLLLDEAGDLIVTLTYAPELPNALWLTEELARRRILPVVGHTEASFEQTEQVILAGARHVTHLFDATLGFKENPEEALVMLPGMETAALLYDQVSVELIGCPIHVPRPFFRFVNKVKPREKKIVVTDSLVGTGKPEGTVFTSSDGWRVRVSEGVIRMVNDDPAIDGNLTGSAVTMNRAVQRVREYAEITLEEALMWGTLNPARALGIDRLTGSIAVGKDADLAVIDQHFDVHFTIVQGRVVHGRT
ncbi:MAG TPA: amidohydrolase family protein [Atribacteraceae bacterium]|nr:amidohydrolase family protein [Atribacteraceae bacterium]